MELSRPARVSHPRPSRPWLIAGRAWLLMVGACFWLGGAAALGWLRETLPAAGQVLLAAILVLSLVLFVVASGLLGPMFFHDVMRIARRGRHVLIRCIYAGLLSLMLFAVYSSYASRPPLTVEAQTGQVVSARRMAQFATAFSSAFLAMQFLAVLVLTPLYTASAITEEKERRTLEFLLATDLSNREIVLGKLAARLAHLSLILLTGLPILGFLQFLGGVDPNLLLLFTAGTGVLMISLGSLAMVFSLVCDTTVNAVFRTYLWTLAYFFLTPNIPLVGAGSPLYVLYRLQFVAFRRGAGQAAIFLDLFRDFVCFHGVLILICCAYVTWGLRKEATRAATQPAEPPPSPRREEARPGDRRPPIGDRPLLWKELHVDAEPLHPFVGGVLILLVVGCVVIFSMATLIELVRGAWQLRHWLEAGRELNPFVRGIGTFLAGIALLHVALRAARSVSRERERHTLDNLLTTPHESPEILLNKWLASIVGVWGYWLALGLIWLLATLTGGLHFLALPLLVVATSVYAAFMASLGLLCSTWQRTTLKAYLWAGFLLLVLFLNPLTVRTSGATPLTGVFVLSFHYEELQNWAGPGAVLSIFQTTAAVLAYALAASILYFLADRCLRADAGPQPQPLRRRPREV